MGFMLHDGKGLEVLELVIEDEAVVERKDLLVQIGREHILLEGTEVGLIWRRGIDILVVLVDGTEVSLVHVHAGDPLVDQSDFEERK